MKSRLIRILSSVIAVIVLITSVPLSAAAAPTVNQIVNAATDIIIYNEGVYTTVVRNDNGALSIGKIGWHATNALNLLKDIVALNPTQALNILGATLYNEIITSTYWESKIPTMQEASALSVLLATAESQRVQDETCWNYILSYVEHGIALGITEPEALIFFADFENQNGYTGAGNYYKEVMATYGVINLDTLYNCSSKNNRRTRTYNFCATVNWADYSSTPSFQKDAVAPEITDVSVSDITALGYTVSCNVSDNEAVTDVYFAVYHADDGVDGAKWYRVESTGYAAFTVDINDFSARAGDYHTYIYAFDGSGNYAYVELNIIKVPEQEPEIPPLAITVSLISSATEIGEDLIWKASVANGSGNYFYIFNLYKDGVLIDQRNYNDYPDFRHTVEETGSYSVLVGVYDTANNTTATTMSTPVNVFTPIEINSFTANQSAAMLGQSIFWTVSAEGGEGDLRYSFTLYRDDEIVYSTEYSTGHRFTFKPTTDGTYNVTANIIDDRSQVVSVKSEDITVIRPLSAENPAFSSAYAVTGQQVSCAADILGGTGSYTCTFSIYCDGRLVLTSESIEASEFTFTVPEHGEYTFHVKVTDADGTVTEASGGSLTVHESAMRGDANCDGIVNAFDARHTLRCAAGIEKYDSYTLAAADIDADGRITAADARRILRAVAQLESL